jgi:hypothetical protein
MFAAGAPSAANLAAAPPPTTATKPPLMSTQNMTPNLREKFAGIDKKLIGVDQKLMGVDQKLQSLTIRKWHFGVVFFFELSNCSLSGSSQLTYTMLSDYHAALVKQNRWQQENNNTKVFPRPSVRACELANKIGAFGNIEHGASERKTIQPAWSAFLTRLGSIQKDLAVEMFDRHKEPTIGTNKPDLVGYFKVEVLSHCSFFFFPSVCSFVLLLSFCASCLALNVITCSGILSMRVQHVFSGRAEIDRAEQCCFVWC